MRKWLLIGLITVITGCVAMPMRQMTDSLPKTNSIYIGEVKIFKGIEVGMSGIKNLGTPADNDSYYQEVVREYGLSLKAELEKSGFKVVELGEVTPRSLIIKTKIGNKPPPLGGWLGIMAMGQIGVQVEVYYNNELILAFEERVNTTLGYKARGQIKRHIAPRIAKKLKEKFD